MLRHGPGVTIELDAFGAVVTPETPLPASSMVTIGPEHSSAVGLASSISLGMLDASEDPLDSSAVAASMSPVTPAKALIAYVGDHLHGDVLAAKRFGWITVAIVGKEESSFITITRV